MVLLLEIWRRQILFFFFLLLLYNITRSPTGRFPVIVPVAMSCDRDNTRSVLGRSDCGVTVRLISLDCVCVCVA